MKTRCASVLVCCCLWVVGCTAQLEKQPVGTQNNQQSNNGNNTTNNANNTGNNTSNNNNNNKVRQPKTFQCDPAKQADALPLKRLSKVQYQNTLRDLLTMSMSAQSSAVVMGELVDPLSSYPEDAFGRAANETHGGFTALDQAVQQTHIDESFKIAKAIGDRVAQDDAMLGQMMGQCALDNDAGNDASCVDGWIRAFGRLATRGPLDEADVTFYKQVYDAQGIDRQAVADVITVMLTAPQFLYHVEHGQQPTAAIDGQPYGLSALELANRLSYHFWQSMPDEALLKAAEDGSLLQEDVYQQQVQRMVSDMKTTASLGMFVRQWLWLDEVPELDGLVGSPLYDAFAGEQAPSSTLRQAMLDEIEALATYYTLQTNGTFDQMFASQKVVTQDEELARIYGVAPWNGQGEPGEFAAGDRAGLITRAALLVNGTANTRPIKKGFQIRKAMLCVQPPPPPDNAANSKVELSDSLTTRQVVEQLTEQEGSDCAGCHQLYINPLGFATEGYDALGRKRQMQRLFDIDGNVVTQKPVDTTSVPRIFLDDLTPSNGPGDLSTMLLESKEVHKCFAQHYARFTLGRVEDEATDGCMMEDIRTQLVEGKPLREVLMSVALRPAFKLRKVKMP